MRGLIEKDLRLTISRKQTLLIFFIMALVMGMTMDGTFIVGYLTMLGAILAVGTISYDEFDNGYAFLMTLPFERKTYVTEKYLFCLCMEAVFWCAGAFIYCLGSLVRNSGGNPAGDAKKPAEGGPGPAFQGGEAVSGASCSRSGPLRRDRARSSSGGCTSRCGRCG